MSAFVITMYLYPVSSTTCTTFIRHLSDYSQVQSKESPFEKWHRAHTFRSALPLVTLPKKLTSKQLGLSYHTLWIPSKNCPYAFMRPEGTRNWDVAQHWLLRGSALQCISCFATSSIYNEHMKYWYSSSPTSPLSLSSVSDGFFTQRHFFKETTLLQYDHEFLPNGQLRDRVEHGLRSQQQFSLCTNLIIIGHQMHPFMKLWKKESTRLEEATMIHL